MPSPRTPRWSLAALAVLLAAGEGCLQPLAVPPIDPSAGVCRVRGVNPDQYPDVQASGAWAQLEGAGPDGSAYLDGDQVRRNGTAIMSDVHVAIARTKGEAVEVAYRDMHSSPTDVSGSRVTVSFGARNFDFEVTGDCSNDDRIVGVALAMNLLIERYGDLGVD